MGEPVKLGERSTRARWAAGGVAAVILAVAGAATIASAGADTVIPSTAASAAGTLYFTTYLPPTIDEVGFSYRQGVLHLSTPQQIARPPGADGVLFDTTGRLIVGGQDTGKVFVVDPSTGGVVGIPAGIPGSFHLALSPDGHILYTAGEPGALAAIPLDPVQAGRPVPLHGANTSVTQLAFGPGGQVVYTSSAPNGRGDIGLVNLATGATQQLFHDVAAAHGIVYDPWSRSYLVCGGDELIQLPASDPRRVVSELVEPGDQFDQAAVTGHGQVLVASNTGTLVFDDYSTTGRVGNLANRVIQEHLAHNLDDVAPLIGPGARPVATSARTRRLAGGGALVAAILLAGGLAASWERQRRRRRPRQRRLPRWDRRVRSHPRSQNGPIDSWISEPRSGSHGT